MELSNMLDLFISALLSLIFSIFIVAKVFDKEIIKNKFKALGIIIGFAICVALINYYDRDKFKIVLTLPFLITSVKYVFDIKFDKALIYSVVSLAYLFIGELITGILFSILPIDYNYILKNIFGSALGSAIVLIFTLPVMYIRPIKTFVNNLSVKYENLSVLIFLVIGIGSFWYMNSHAINDSFEFLINLFVLFLFFLMAILYFKENMKSKEMSDKYNELLSTVDTFEKELITKRKIIHDFKNQLIVINGYADNPEKLKAYLSEIIKDQRNIPNSKLLLNVEKLPSGLKGLIYYKFSNLDSNINVSIDIKNSLKKYESISPKLNKDCLKILGVFIDNAIEAVKNEKEKYINLEFIKQKEQIIITVRNTCTSRVNIKDLTKNGFTTKGKNHGYGLSLVSDIVRKDDSLDIKFECDDDIFSATLVIRL
ncbi:MAG: GHKL domain-containing protein [bacterium]|nr:GHKL domain-containing protein [bacterium]MDY4108869.1 GHKL domain-containing protein [Bacilli bacterium]